ncbi:uncharacterized protein LOC114517660 [Dendronephthya gigantea]|uniref:uncharacterized protein LOC114517660 n=1 Tax=Dendronephthya gigantea TaxID=151771 RepID=UPI00106C4620|nr:uncharacterized protein LOC114517660 [Dendronephthya gigantea]
MSYFMLRGRSPSMGFINRQLHKGTFKLTKYGPTVNRYHKFTATGPYAYMPTYHDRTMYEEIWGGLKYHDIYVEIQLHGVHILDGHAVIGGQIKHETYIFLVGNSWPTTITRWAVNYTSDYKEWTRYKNKDGEEHHFRLLEMTRKDGMAYPGYHKFEPRIIANRIRILQLSYRVMAAGLGGCFAVELFGCSYDGENAGLQTPVKKEKGTYWLTNETVYPWQLYAVFNRPAYTTVPEKQVAMVLSKYYVDDLEDGMLSIYGHCQPYGKYPARLILAQKGEFWFPDGSPLRYRLRDGNTPECITNFRDYINDPLKSLECFQNLAHFKKSWDIPASKKIKYEPRKGYRTRYIAATNELETVVNKKIPQTNFWCAQKFVNTKFYFKPYPTKRTTDCSDIILAFGDSYCKNSLAEYWEIDLKKIFLIDSLKFKGHKDSARKSWASRVKVMYSEDKDVWLLLKQRYLTKADFKTNTGSRHTSHHFLNPRIKARYLRITAVAGSRDRCMRVEIRGCSKEPWLQAKQKVKDDAKRIGLNMWHVVVFNKNKGKRFQIKCYHDDARANVIETVYEIIGSYEFPLKRDEIRLLEWKDAKIYKCVARDQLKRVVSTQIYIITSYGTNLLIPVQEQGLLHQGGSPLFNPYGTIWTHEPVTAKLTFLHFPNVRTSYEWYGRIGPLAWRSGGVIKSLGKARTRRECLQLAIFAEEKYFIFSSKIKQCFAGWAIPYLVDPRENLFEKYKDAMSVYEIQYNREPYSVNWRHGGTQIGGYEHQPKRQKTIVSQLLPFSSGKFQFRSDGGFTRRSYDMHSLIIKDFTVNEVKDYTLEIMTITSIPRLIFKRAVVLRHYGEPRLSMPPTGGACINHPLIITAVPIRGEYVEAVEWDVEWRKIENGKAFKTKMETQDPFVLKAERAALRHSGVYRIRVKNRYGFAEGTIQIDVVENPPSIISVTSSPHVAVEDSSDVLHVDMRNEDGLVSIDWYYNGKLIKIEDKHFSFPGAHPGRPDTRKMLKLSNLHSGMSGVFKVIAKARFCEFTKEIVVDVYVRPKMIVIPNVRTLYQIAGGDTTIVQVVVAGGNPTPEREHLVWYKDSKLLEVTRSGRVRVQNQEWLEKKGKSSDDIQNEKRKRIGWNSTLSITSPRVSDSGKYSFMVSFPRTNYTVERIIKVTKL